MLRGESGEVGLKLLTGALGCGEVGAEGCEEVRGRCCCCGGFGGGTGWWWWW